MTTAAVSELRTQHSARSGPELSPIIYEIVILCLEIIAVLGVAAGLGVAAFELMRWPGFLVVCGATLLAAAWWANHMMHPTPPPPPPGRPPVTLSRESIEPPPLTPIIARTWWRFAWLNSE